MKNNKDFVNDLDTAIEVFFDNKISNAPNQRSIELLVESKKLILRGGKRSRPKLFILTLKAYANNANNKYLNLALAIEIYHQFLLIHDDIIDKDFIRYGGPNIAGHYLPEFNEVNNSIPNSMALLAGDLMFSYVYEIIANDKNLSSQQKIDITKLFSIVNESVIYGQQMDTLNVTSLNSQVGIKQLIEIHTLKTAIYSIMMPMKLAGIIQDLNNDELKKIEVFSHNFGVFYQLADDHSDYFANSSVFNNRDKYRDYKEGRITSPIIYGINNSKIGDNKFIQNNLGDKNLSDKKMKKLLSILKNCGAEQKSKELAQSYYEKAISNLDELSINNKSKSEFTELMSSFML